MTCAVLLLSACGTPLVPQAPIEPTATPHRQIPAIPLGTAVGYSALMSDARYRDVLRRNFTMLVPENEMKFDAIEPQEGVFDFSKADALVNFAEANGMEVRGHALVSAGQLPNWLTNGTFSRQQLLDILKAHIFAEVGHYRGRVVAWDVVNEPMNGAQLRDDIWLRGIGPDYIKWAFTWAHQADPQAKLYLNDYSDEGLNETSDAIYAIARNMRQQGIPISGVGLEMHTILAQPPADPASVAANISRFGTLGLEVSITEMDVLINGSSGTVQEKLQAQARFYGAIASACRSSSACKAFVVWGVTDTYSWKRGDPKHPDAPLLFDANYQPKPAFYAVEHALYGGTAAPTTTATP